MAPFRSQVVLERVERFDARVKLTLYGRGAEPLPVHVQVYVADVTERVLYLRMLFVEIVVRAVRLEVGRRLQYRRRPGTHAVQLGGGVLGALPLGRFSGG